jgi:hypothetical protein
MHPHLRKAGVWFEPSFDGCHNAEGMATSPVRLGQLPTRKQSQLQDLVVFLYWRCYAGRADSGAAAGQREGCEGMRSGRCEMAMDRSQADARSFR